MKRRKFNKNIFFGSVLPYVSVIIIVFVFHMVSTSVVLKGLENNAVAVAENSFKANVSVIEENMKSVRETAIAVSQNVYKKLDGEKESGVLTRLFEAKSVLETYYVSSNVIKNICVQNDKNDLLVNFDTVYSKRINFYASMLKSEALTAEEMLANSEKANGFTMEDNCYSNENSSCPVFFLPSPLMSERTGSVSIYMDKNALLLPMEDLIKNRNGVLFIKNQDGKMLISEGENARKVFDVISEKKSDKRVFVGKNPHCVFRHTDKISKWEYIMVIPEEYVIRDTKFYQGISFLLNFIALAAGFILCLFFVLRKSSAYVELLEMLGIDSEKFKIKNLISNNEYEYLSQHISKIKDENAVLLERDNQNILRMLLNGEFENDEAIRKELEKHNMNFEYKKYGVMILYHKDKRITGSFADNFQIFILREIQNVIPDAKIYFGERNRTVIVFSLDTGEENFNENVNMYISRLEIDVLFKYRIPVVCGVGSCACELTQIAAAFNEAKAVVKYNVLMEDKNVRFYTLLPDRGIDYCYTSDMRNMLSDGVLDCDFEKCRAVLEKIREENFQNRSLSPEAAEDLLNELRRDFKRIGKIRTEELEFVRDNESVSHFFEYAVSFFYLLCTEYEKEPISRSEKLCRDVEKYIEENYKNVNLNLPSIAEEFRLHPNYISTLFKQQMNCSIVSYIEELRIKEAAKLLREGKHTVNEVSLLVGFSNVGTFRRVFKKIKGVTPTNYFKS